MREHERRARITFFTEASPETRASSFRILEELSRFASVVVSVPEPTEPEGRDRGESATEIQHRPAYGGTMAGFLARLPILLIPTWRSILRAVSGADLVVSRIPSPIVGLVDRAARRKGLPHVLYVVADIEAAARGTTSERPSLRRMLKRLAGGWIQQRLRALSSGRLVVAIGQALAEQYRSKARRCEVFYVSSVRENEIFERTDTCQSGIVKALHVTRLVPLKGTESLLEALRLLRADGYDVHLTVVGPGPQLGRLLAICRSRSMEDHVTFTGSLAYGDRLLELYRRADVFVHPSLSESFPRVLWEAMAAHLPIVATDVGDVGSILRAESAGLVVPSRSSRELARAIARVIDDGPLRRALIRRGGELVRGYTVEKQGQRLWKLLSQDLVDDRRAR
jgi:glycosyltransferase involved in cell wall biosynthesis